MRIGLISDTHGLVRPEAVRALRGVDAIVMAGDIGKPHVLEELGSIAPLHAIRGNVDVGKWADPVPTRATVELGGRSIHVVHDIAEIDPADLAGVDVVVYGHSHKPAIESREGRLYVNPGSAGPRRFRLPITLAYLDIEPDGVSAELVELVEPR
jgi:putative phosphoesterase